MNALELYARPAVVPPVRHVHVQYRPDEKAWDLVTTRFHTIEDATRALDRLGPENEPRSWVVRDEACFHCGEIQR